ncbi:DEHA2G18546p [Debaryomyces hansenii CBS767]|uniref:Tyrosine--tRNA ligase n=1 Tax=Debaryomyces hansenii (strain ATCC 36239 / CBS 767 / BCRC 21394 / JCM 1990 / NBRC 0083 / IGC 2968) TaxID=284592 RepID=Q6BHH5_DEBHA|nr:DEHA2G18546p [Debaryomyces hansenii CBS767]CAG90853.1 DEHA2G18546p [Debaryomyces hansenii CBS767]|eukprot:XP_462346.1 DEHA2G18546p [Debaryomyces hansenii CBS767]
MSVISDPTEQYNLITKNLQEVLNGAIIKNVLENEKRPLKIYWGTAPTGKPHCGYFVGMLKLAHFLKAGCEVKVLLADLHAFLDNMKAPLEVVNYRAKYYECVVKAILKSINVPIDKLIFVVGSSYQLTAEYTMDIFRMSNSVSQNDAKRAGADVVKQVANPLLSGLIYPLMQALDEEYLGVDAQFGGVDQRKIFVLAEENLQSIGYKKRAHLMNPMVPGLGQGGKMSASDPNSKIDILEDPKQVRKKVNSAYCAPGEIENNGLIAFIEYVIQPIQELKAEKDGVFKLDIDRPEKYGGPISYDSIDEIKADFASEKLSPVDLKSGVAEKIIELLAPIRESFEASEEFKEAQAKGYPVEQPKSEKKVKKQKNKGTRYPGAGNTKEGDNVSKVSEQLESTNIE